MANSQDILLDDDGDIIIENGDFKIGDSDYQHIKDNIDAQKGWFRESSHLGCAVWNKLNGVIDSSYMQTIRVNLEADGYKVQKVSVSETGELLINAER
jgi:hypothetical protein